MDWHLKQKLGRCWDGYRQSIDPILSDYYMWLQDKISMDLDKQLEDVKRCVARARKYIKSKDNNTGKYQTIKWIEKLIDTPLDGYRKYTTKFVIVPYLKNIRRLEYADIFDIASTWLNECDSLNSLRFNVDRKINEALNNVGDYLPQG
jgi:hypothetical protein